MRTVQILLLFVVGVLSVVGCGSGSSTGGSGSQQTPGALEFNIVWPSASRVIPAAAQSLVIDVSSSGTALAHRIIARPPAGTNTTSIRIDSLRPGVAAVTVSAFPNSDGTGVLQAIGATTVAIISGVTTQATIDPSSTVDHIDLIPAEVSAVPTHVKTLVASPRNAQNALVLVAPSSLQWTSNLPAIATVDTAGHVTPIAFGNAVIRVVDSESGQTTTSTVHVVPPVVVTPPQLVLSIGDQASFTATTTDLASQNVTWSVLEGSAGGVIDSEGVYTAPLQAGTYHIVATSVSEPALSGTATVTVQSGSGTIIIR